MTSAEEADYHSVAIMIELIDSNPSDRSLHRRITARLILLNSPLFRDGSSAATSILLGSFLHISSNLAAVELTFVLILSHTEDRNNPCVT
jgi:hypothetical protein